MEPLTDEQPWLVWTHATCATLKTARTAVQITVMKAYSKSGRDRTHHDDQRNIRMPNKYDADSMFFFQASRKKFQVSRKYFQVSSSYPWKVSTECGTNEKMVPISTEKEVHVATSR